MDFHQRYATLGLGCNVKSRWLILGLSLAGLLAACLRPIAPNWTAITLAKVTYDNHLTGKGGEPFKSIEMTGEITPLIQFVERQLRARTIDSCSMLNAESAGTVKLSFYQGNEYRGTFAVGGGNKQFSFAKYYGYGHSNAWCLSEKERQEFLAFVGFSETNYQKLFRW